MTFSTEYYRSLRLSVRYDAVIFPMETTRLLRAVAERGFIIPESAEQPPLGARLGLKGTIARKGGVLLTVDSDKQILGIAAKDIETLLDEFDSLEKVLADEFEQEGNDVAMFYELITSMIVKTDKDTLEEWSRLSSELPIFSKFSQIIGGEVAPFGLRFAPKGQGPNQPDWYDVRIEPNVQAPYGRYVVEIVYRNSDRSTVLKFVESLESTVESLIGVIEE